MANGVSKNLSFHTDFKNANLILLLVKSTPKKGLAKNCFENQKNRFLGKSFLGSTFKQILDFHCPSFMPHIWASISLVPILCTENNNPFLSCKRSKSSSAIRTFARHTYFNLPNQRAKKRKISEKKKIKIY